MTKEEIRARVITIVSPKFHATGKVIGETMEAVEWRVLSRDEIVDAITDFISQALDEARLEAVKEFVEYLELRSQMMLPDTRLMMREFLKTKKGEKNE